MGEVFSRQEFAQLEALKNANDLQGYYSFLSSKGYNYGALALGVVNDDGLSGIVARDYAETVAAQRNVTVNWNSVSASLADQDFRVRQELFNRDSSKPLTLNHETIQEYHNTVFLNHGIPVEAWTPNSVLNTSLNPSQTWDNLINPGLISIDDNIQFVMELAQYAAREYRDHRSELYLQDGSVNPDTLGNQEWIRENMPNAYTAAILHQPVSYGNVLLEILDGITLEPLTSLFNSIKSKILPPAVPETYPCFVAGTLIINSNRAAIPIEEITVGDKVLAFNEDDKKGCASLTPRRVSYTKVTQNKPVIDFHGTQATPDHVFLTEDGAFMQLTDILEADGVVIREDGSKLRARTGWPVYSKEDQIIPVGYEDKSGETQIAPMRAGTVCSRRGKKIFTLAGMMHERGYELQADGRFIDADGDVVTAFWHWGIPDSKLFAGQHADYRTEIEACADGDALFVSLGAPAMTPSHPAPALQAKRAP